MKRFALFCVLAGLLPGMALAEPYRIVSTDRSGVTIEFLIGEPELHSVDTAGVERACRVSLADFYTCDVPGTPVLPVRRFFFAVPDRDGVRLEVIDQESVFVPGVVPTVAFENGSPADRLAALAAAPPLDESSFVALSGVELIRKRPVAFVDVRPVLFDPERRGLLRLSRLVVRISFRPAAGGGEGGGTFLVDDLVANAAQASEWKTAAPRAASLEREPFEFARSDRWVRLGVRERGIHIVTYNDLLAAGVNPAAIDPATLRLFSGGAFKEPDSLSGGGSYLDDYRFTEHAIHYRGPGVGSFQSGDTLFFHGVGVNGWADEYEVSADPWVYVEHPYEREHVYWLTWGGSFSGPARRMAERSVAQSGPYDTTITWYEARFHREEDFLYDPIYTDDRWYWRQLSPNGTSTFVDEFTCSDLAEPVGFFKTMAYGPYNANRFQNTATYRVNDAVVGTLVWTVPPGYNPSGMKTLFAGVSNLVEGRNTLTVTKPLDNGMYIFWYEIAYRRLLRALGGSLDFAAPARPLRARFALSGFPAGERLLFDVSRNEAPVLCTGWSAAGNGIAFQDSIGPARRRYLAVSRSALRKPTLSFAAVPSLRDESACPHMIIVYHEAFRNAALMLAEHRRRGIDGIAAPVVRAVDIRDVYNNFSGGHKDPIAVRNYLKFLYDRPDCAGGGDPALSYVLLVGNGTYDPRNVLGRSNDFLPFYMNRYPNESEAIEDEDFLVKLDGGVDRAPDLAIGRMSVLTDREANAWAQRVVDYEERPEYGPWREKVILCADDEFSTSRDNEFDFLLSTEELARRNGPFPTVADLRKIYLHAYPFFGDVKPAARRDLLREWSDGALIVNYMGHGSPQQMADERVMVNSDIYSLTNATRRPLMLSFSCSVGDLDSPYQRSMAQNMVTYDGGGAIGTISAAAPTYHYPNSLLNAAIYRALFTSKDSTGTRPVGLALQLAKYAVVTSLMGSGYERNNVKYLCLGDPALKLALPAHRVEIETASIDTLLTGERYRVEGSIRSGGTVYSSWNGTADVVVQEAEQNVRLLYVLPGAEFFRGTVDVTAGRFAASFVVPRRCRTGPHARIRVYASSGFADGAGACDTLLIVPSDTLRKNEEPPRVNLYFAGQATKVKAGAKLIADISDDDGIAILGSDPQSSIFLEFDGSGYPIYVTDYFTYDHGSYTSGTVEYPLAAGFEPGRHTVLLKVFDNLGAASSDTLSFEIVEEGLYALSDVFNLPNPFSNGTNFVFQTTSPGAASIRVYTVSGVMVWERRVAATEGFNSVYWDGRDLAGDRLANGTYLYVLEMDFSGSYHRKETVEGKAVLLR
jgi:hypothetical protein